MAGIDLVENLKKDYKDENGQKNSLYTYDSISISMLE